jgi:IstB-like ATP binding protein
LIAARYERRSMMITANQPFGEWGKIFPEPTLSWCLLFGTLGVSYTSAKPIDLFVR